MEDDIFDAVPAEDVKTVKPIDEVVVELSFVLGETQLPIHELMRLGRGAVVELDATDEDDIQIMAGDTQIASGQLRLDGEQIEIVVSKNMLRPKTVRPPSKKFIKPAMPNQNLVNQ